MKHLTEYVKDRQLPKKGHSSRLKPVTIFFFSLQDNVTSKFLFLIINSFIWIRSFHFLIIRIFPMLNLLLVLLFYLQSNIQGDSKVGAFLSPANRASKNKVQG